MLIQLTRVALAAAIAMPVSAPVARAQDRDRSDDVHWLIELTIKDGRGDELAPLGEEMVAATEAEEGAVAYEWYRSGDTVHMLERFDDAEAAMAHLDTFEGQFAERYFDLLEPTAWSVYGPASDALKERVSAFGAVFYEKVDGFAR